MLERCFQGRRQPFRFVVEVRAGMESVGFQHERARLVQQPVAEIEANAAREGNPEFDREEFIISGSGLVAEPAFDHREQRVGLLQRNERSSQVAEEFAPGHLQDFKVAAIIDVIT